MIVTIPDLLDSTELGAVRAELRRGRFVDGRLSAGRDAAAGKRNEELEAAEDAYRALNDVVMTRLVRHPRYLQSALPARIAAPIYARYTAGMAYDAHIDDPIMGPPGARYRSDIAITIFLSAPDDYAGGELRIEAPQGPVTFKLPAGHALLYPANSYHAVAPVESGERLVAITWVQSHVRRADQREILVELDRARELLTDADGDARRKLDLCYANLFRLWAEA